MHSSCVSVTFSTVLMLAACSGGGSRTSQDASPARDGTADYPANNAVMRVDWFRYWKE